LIEEPTTPDGLLNKLGFVDVPPVPVVNKLLVVVGFVVAVAKIFPPVEVKPCNYLVNVIYLYCLKKYSELL